MPVNNVTHVVVTQNWFHGQIQAHPGEAAFRNAANNQLSQGAAAYLLGPVNPIYADAQAASDPPMSNRQALAQSIGQGDPTMVAALLQEVEDNAVIFGPEAAEEYAGYLLEGLRSERPQVTDEQLETVADSLDFSGLTRDQLIKAYTAATEEGGTHLAQLQNFMTSYKDDPTVQGLGWALFAVGAGQGSVALEKFAGEVLENLQAAAEANLSPGELAAAHASKTHVQPGSAQDLLTQKLAAKVKTAQEQGLLTADQSATAEKYLAQLRSDVMGPDELVIAEALIDVLLQRNSLTPEQNTSAHRLLSQINDSTDPEEIAILKVMIDCLLKENSLTPEQNATVHQLLSEINDSTVPEEVMVGKAMIYFHLKENSLTPEQKDRALALLSRANDAQDSLVMSSALAELDALLATVE